MDWKTSILNFLCVLSVALGVVSCSDEDCNPQIIPGCVCPAIYDPVCGCDGMTYGNACEADCNSVTIEKEGECN